MTTIKDMLLSALRDIGADGAAWIRWIGRHRAVYGATLAELEEDIFPVSSGYFDGRPAFRDDEGRLVPLPDWLEYSGGPLLTGRGQTGEEVQLWYHGDRFELWIGRYATSDEDDDIELVSDDYPTAPEAWAAAEAWIKEQAR